MQVLYVYFYLLLLLYMQVCLTLLLMSSLRVLFYGPLAGFRIMYLVYPSAITSIEFSLQILVIGVLCYSFVIPVHVVKFFRVLVSRSRLCQKRAPLRQPAPIKDDY